MAEYSSLKVPELKKLLAEKSLPQTGNKADLIARLLENDKKVESEAKSAENKEDEISYSDDEAPAEPAVAEPAKEEPAQADPDATEPAKEVVEEKAVETEEKPEEPEEPAQSYAIGLASTAADEEAKKRADRAKRFGLEEDEDAQKRADRAKRFGLDANELASSLDSALPERPRKRGRDRGDGDNNNNPRNNKRQSLDRRGGRRRGRDGREGGRDGGREGGSRRDGAQKRSGLLEDPAEKAKAEKRAARFAAN